MSEVFASSSVIDFAYDGTSESLREPIYQERATYGVECDAKEVSRVELRVLIVLGRFSTKDDEILPSRSSLRNSDQASFISRVLKITLLHDGHEIHGNNKLPTSTYHSSSTSSHSTGMYYDAPDQGKPLSSQAPVPYFQEYPLQPPKQTIKLPGHSRRPD